VRYLRRHAQEHALDPHRLAALGHSSGAYLALMVGLTAGSAELEGPGPWLEASSDVCAVVNIAGVVDRRAGLGTGTAYLLGDGYEKKAELRRLASPVVHVGPHSPPIYTLQGEADTIVVPASAEQLAAAMQAAGVEHRLHLAPAAGHDPVTFETLGDVARWLTERLTEQMTGSSL
jgi:acetyl esterase/lipase